MSEIFDIIWRFWEISENKVISLCVIVALLLILSFWKFKQTRHPRYRGRIIIVTTLLLLSACAYIACWVVFSTWHIYIWALGLILILAIIISVYTPVIAYPLLMMIEKNIEAGNVEKTEKLFAITKFFTFSMKAKLRYKQELAAHYEQEHRYQVAYDILNNIKQKTLFQNEIDIIEMHMAHYLISLGAFKKAKIHLSKVKTKVPMLLLLEMNIDDACGNTADDFFEKARHVIDLITPKTTDYVKAQLYSNFSLCRKAQNNYSDALFYAKKAVDCAKKSKSDLIIARTYEHLISLISSEEPTNEQIPVMLDEYLKLLDPKKPNNFFRGFNFLIKYYRMRNQKEILLPIIANGYTAQIHRLKSLQKYHWEVSMLDVAQHADIHIGNIMRDVMIDFDEFYNVDMPHKYQLIQQVHRALDVFFANDAPDIEFENEYRLFFERSEKYLINDATTDLKNYYDTLTENEVYERTHILKSIVSVSALRDWHSGVKRYDKMLGSAHMHNLNVSGHAERIKTLKDIADIYNTNGIIPALVDAYISIIEECYSIYYLEHEESYEINVANKDEMENCLIHLTNLLEQPINKKRYRAAQLNVATALYVLGRTEEALVYYKSFDEKELYRFNRWFKNHFTFLEDVLQ